MPLSLTRMRGVAARRRLQELSGDAATANQFTSPRVRSLLQAGTMQRTRYRSDVRDPRQSFREATDLTRQREADIRQWAELALRSKDSEFARKMDERRMGMMAAEEGRRRQRFPMEMERSKFDFGEARDRAKRVATQTDLDRAQAAADEARRVAREGRTESEFEQSQRERDAAATRRKGQYWQDWANTGLKAIQTGMELRQSRAKQTRADAEHAQKMRMNQVALDAAIRESKPVNQSPDIYIQGAVGLGVPQDTLYYDNGELKPKARAYLDRMEQLMDERPNATSDELVREAARGAHLLSARGGVQATIRRLKTEVTQGTAASAKKNKQEIAKLEDQLKGMQPSPLDTKVPMMFSPARGRASRNGQPTSKLKAELAELARRGDPLAQKTLRRMGVQW